jgi:hypothetical protein
MRDEARSTMRIADPTRAPPRRSSAYHDGASRGRDPLARCAPTSGRPGLLAALLIGAGAAGCAERAVTAPSAAPPAVSSTDPAPPFEGHAVATSAGAYRVRFRPRPEDLPLNEMFALEVRVADAATGAPVGADVTIDVDAGMPAHRHGMNTRPRVERMCAGAFLVRGMLLHMPGEWVLSFDVTKGGVTERAQVSLVLE